MEPKLRAKYDEPLDSELKRILKKVEEVKNTVVTTPGTPGETDYAYSDAEVDTLTF